MRISEIEAPQKSLQQIHQQWIQVSKADGDTSTAVYNKALEFSQAGADPVQAHAQALSAYNQTVDNNQDRQAQKRQADRTAKGFTGTSSDPSKLAIQGHGDSQSTGPKTRGGQVGNKNAYKGGPVAKGKSIKQAMKDKWKDFNDQDGFAGKDIAKGKYIAKGIAKAGSAVAGMGDKFRQAPKSR